MRNLIYIFLIILLFSCSESKYKHKEIILNKYLEENFNYNIPKEETIIILIPKISCNGCVNSFVNDFNTIIDTSKTSITLITSSIEYYNRLKLYKKINLLYDENEIIDRINLELTSVTLFYTKEHKIYNILNF